MKLHALMERGHHDAGGGRWRKSFGIDHQIVVVRIVQVMVEAGADVTAPGEVVLFDVREGLVAGAE